MQQEDQSCLGSPRFARHFVVGAPLTPERAVDYRRYRATCVDSAYSNFAIGRGYTKGIVADASVIVFEH